MLLAPDMPPTTPKKRVDILLEPPSESAEPLAELSYRLQSLRVTWALPWAEMAPLALLSSASRQPVPPVPTATARAEMVNSFEDTTAENCGVCNRSKTTSTAPAVVV